MYDNLWLICDDNGISVFNENGIVDAIRNNHNINIPNNIVLYPNYPNPFNNSTIIRFSISKFTNVKMDIYNCLGEYIRNIFNHKVASGYHEVNIQFKNESSGIYFYRISTTTDVKFGKIIFIK